MNTDKLLEWLKSIEEEFPTAGDNIRKIKEKILSIIAESKPEKSIEECKDEVAKKNHFKNWRELLYQEIGIKGVNDWSYKRISKFENEAILLYSQCHPQTLELDKEILKWLNVKKTLCEETKAGNSYQSAERDALLELIKDLKTFIHQFPQSKQVENKSGEVELLELLNKMDDEGRLTTPEQNIVRKMNLRTNH